MARFKWYSLIPHQSLKTSCQSWTPSEKCFWVRACCLQSMTCASSIFHFHNRRKCEINSAFLIGHLTFYASFEWKIRLYKMHASINQPGFCQDSAGHFV